MDKLFNCNFVVANFKDENLDTGTPISWEHNYNTGKTTIYIHSREKLSEFEENAIKGYVIAQCYPEMFEKWLQKNF